MVTVAPRRSRTWRAATSWVLALLAGGLVWAALSFVRYPVALAAGGIVAIMAWVRSFRIAISIGDAGVRVHNFWRTWDCGWSDLQSVHVGTKWYAFLPNAIVFELKAGGSFLCEASATAGVQDRNRIASLVREYGSANGTRVRINRDHLGRLPSQTRPFT